MKVNWKVLHETECPKYGKLYYNLPDDAKFIDLCYAIRADEACNRDMNHKLSSLNEDTELENEEIMIKNWFNKIYFILYYTLDLLLLELAK